MPVSIARTQCSKSVPSSADTRGRPYASCSSARERRRLQERHALVEHAGVAGRADVLGDDVRQPEQIVGAARCGGRGRSARATSAARRPRRTAGRRRAAGARAPGPAARTTAPSRPAADRGSRRRRPAGSSPPRVQSRQLTVLIQQPPVHQRVERIVRRADLDRVERRVPGRLHASPARPAAASTVPWRAISCARVIAVGALAQQEQRAGGARRAAARIGTCSAAQGSSAAPNWPDERRVAQRGRARQVAVAADERAAVARGGARRARSRARTRRGRANSWL